MLITLIVMLLCHTLIKVYLSIFAVLPCYTVPLPKSTLVSHILKYALLYLSGLYHIAMFLLQQLLKSI